MPETLVLAGLACLAAAIVGGGLKGFGVEIPLLKSTLRQLVLGLFGLALIAAGVAPNVMRMVSERQTSSGSGTTTDADASAGSATSTPPPATPGRPPAAVPPRTRPPVRAVDKPMNVRCGASPATIRPGKAADITVEARDSDGRPVVGADVKLEAGGGTFTGAGTSINGRTDTNGRFVVRWTSPNPAAAGYVLGVTVTRDGFARTTAACRITVQ